MKCPFCATLNSQVVETRFQDDSNTNRRRRQCAACEKRFTTYERLELLLPHIVKKDGRRVDYSREKLNASFYLALRKRPIPVQSVDDALMRIEEKLTLYSEREIPSHLLGEWVMQELQQLDKVAYIRFASVYRRFEDIEDFKTMMDEMDFTASKI